MNYLNPNIKMEKEYFGEVVSVEPDNDSLNIFGTTACLKVFIISNNIIRFRLSPNGIFPPDFSYAVKPLRAKQATHSIKYKTNEIEIKTQSINCKINRKSLKLSMQDEKGNVFYECGDGMHWEENREFGGYYVYNSHIAHENESFFGLGDKPTDFNLRGKRLRNWGSDTYGFEKSRDPLYKGIPFYMGLNNAKGYGIFFDNTFDTHFDFGYENDSVASFWAHGGELNFYYIHGPQLIDVVEQYATLTGTHYLPPLWSLGYHQCKWSYYPESVVKSLTNKFRKKKIPCDAVYLDIEYMDGFRCFTWDKESFPNPKKMIKELKESGFKTVVIIDPGIKIDNNYWVYQEGIKGNHFCKRGDGALMEGMVWPGKCNFPDFTNPKVRKWWANLFKEYVEIGVDGIWNDMNEPAVFDMETFPDDVRHDYDGYNCSHRKAHNIYGMQMVRATYMGLTKYQKNKRPFTISRSGYAGVQRYASVWTGDNVATWEHLKIANIQCQRLSISGISFVGSDIGGFTGNPNGELYTRWIQLGTFSPLFRTHSAGDEADQEPWSYGKKYEKIVKKFIELRYQLLPYLYTAFWQCTTMGTPIIRPLVFLDQYNFDTHYREDEFGFGDNILVCPINEPMVNGRSVYLPEGEWYHYFTNELFEGKQESWIDCPLDSMPIFIKAGAILPHFPIMQYVGEKKIDVLSLHVYFKIGEHESVLYQDHGDNLAYKQGIYSIKHFKLVGSQQSIIITQRKHGLFNSSYKFYKIIIHGLPFKATTVIDEDGSEIKIKWEDNTPVIMVRKYINKLTIL
ncbi:MAG: DUF4968 domain-containing protein [Flavobacteriales bacterium]|nr:DUF4968 domain-containing protein [Flavobacteriales bacterium]